MRLSFLITALFLVFQTQSAYGHFLHTEEKFRQGEEAVQESHYWKISRDLAGFLINGIGLVSAANVVFKNHAGPDDALKDSPQKKVSWLIHGLVLWNTIEILGHFANMLGSTIDLKNIISENIGSDIVNTQFQELRPVYYATFLFNLFAISQHLLTVFCIQREGVEHLLSIANILDIGGHLNDIWLSGDLALSASELSESELDKL